MASDYTEMFLKEAHQVIDVAVVAGVVHRLDARPRAALDVVEQARPAQPLVADELGVRAGPHREAAHQQIEGRPDRPGMATDRGARP